MKKNSRAFAKIELLPVLLSMVMLVIGMVILWAKLSFITSGVKAVTNNCNETWVIEKVLGADWFCPDSSN